MCETANVPLHLFYGGTHGGHLWMCIGDGISTGGSSVFFFGRISWGHLADIFFREGCIQGFGAMGITTEKNLG